MAQSSDAARFEIDDEQYDMAIPDTMCPECGNESVATYIDRYSEYEYCTNCDWSDEEDEKSSSVEPIRRSDRALGDS